MNVHVLSGISRNGGGLFYSVRWLSQALKKIDVDVILLGRRDAYSDEDQSVWGPVPVRSYESRSSIFISGELKSQLAESHADLVHVHGIWIERQWAALKWQMKTGRPVVISPRGMLDPWAVKNASWKKKMVGLLFANTSLHQASCIHALCQSEVESIRAYGLKGPIALIPNGVELPDFSDSKPDRPRAQKVLLFLGRIHPKKGLDELLQGWAMISTANRDEWTLCIAGWDDGGHEAGLKKLAETLGVSESVSFVGPKYGEEKEQLLRTVDGFILPSFSEGLPMSVLEAWSYCIPVLMTEFCNIPEGFAHDAAVKIEPSGASIADGLKQFMMMTDAGRGAMAANGRQLVEQKFTWSKIASDMKEVYEWCINGGAQPACVETD